jgi:hypothetical protein
MFPDGPNDGRMHGPDKGPYQEKPIATKSGKVIKCEECGIKMVSVIGWKQVRAAYGEKEIAP